MKIELSSAIYRSKAVVSSVKILWKQIRKVRSYSAFNISRTGKKLGMSSKTGKEQGMSMRRRDAHKVDKVVYRVQVKVVLFTEFGNRLPFCVPIVLRCSTRITIIINVLNGFQ